MFESEEEVVKHDWDIRLEGRAWNGPEAWARFELAPEKIEMIQGKVFWCDEVRLTMLALLLENLGVEKVVRLGKADVWRKALEALPKSS